MGGPGPEQWGVDFHLARAEHYQNVTQTLAGVEVRTTSTLGNGYVDLLLSNGTAIDCKDWTGFNGLTSEGQDERIDQLVEAARKYLASANVTNLVFEFKVRDPNGRVPTAVATALATRVAVPAGKSLTWVPIQA